MLINLEIQNHEVPALRQAVGWEGRDSDYPVLFEHCLFWAGLRDKNGNLIAFGYMVGPGIEHGYLEDVIVHPSYQGKGIGNALVKRLMKEAEDRGISIVTVTLEESNRSFYEECGFASCPGGVWRKH
ncbi:GNAT family N-acetyltransferase [Clostridium amazonitimonense]|uniref:GNAT family N-acetyltransferase n=1 Tax=Clostridium amazonitimonense TaxID=1499689 RepID=UPI000509E1CD